MNNLTNRPFLIIKIFMKPKASVKTNENGWNTRQNTEFYENFSIVDRVSNSTMRDYSVIIDVFQAKVIKNNIENVDDDYVLSYYMNKYEPNISVALDRYLMKNADETIKKKALSGEISKDQEKAIRNNMDMQAILGKITGIV